MTGGLSAAFTPPPIIPVTSANDAKMASKYRRISNSHELQMEFPLPPTKCGGRCRGSRLSATTARRKGGIRPDLIPSALQLTGVSHLRQSHKPAYRGCCGSCLCRLRPHIIATACEGEYWIATQPQRSTPC